MSKDFNIEDVNEQLIIRFLNGQLSVEEIQKLNKWIAASPRNGEIFSDYQKIWIACSSFSGHERFNTRNAWKNIARAINSPTHLLDYHSRKRARRIYLKFSKIAALLIIVFTVGAIASYFAFYQYDKFSGEEISVISTPRGSRSKVILPDSSIVWLNAESRISYSNDFNNTGRTVKLEGEAFFDVTTKPRKPFIVSAADLEVKATGTKFNVKAYPEEDAISTTLVEGSVHIKIPGKEKTFKYNLKPNQSFTYTPSKRDVPLITDNKKITAKEGHEPVKEESSESVLHVKHKARILLTTNIRPERYTSWKDDKWIIEGEPLDNMAVMLERRFNTKINLQTEELKIYRFTGKIMNETLEQILEILRKTTPLKYSVGKGFVDWELDPVLKKEYDLLIDSKE